MKLDQFSQDDILQLFNVITKEGSQFIFMVDQALRIQYINKAFGDYVKKDVSEVIDHEFGEALGCSHIDKDQKSCAFTAYCKTCEIRKNLHKAFLGVHQKIEFDLVREFHIAGETLVRHLFFKLIPIHLESGDYVFCLVSDQRNSDDLTMFFNPQASI